MSGRRSTTRAARKSLWRSPLALVKAVFTHHVRLRREERGLAFVLEPEAPKVTGMRGAKPLHTDADALQMHADLRAALSAAPGSRHVMRHLATVERKLWETGALFLYDLPRPTLKRVREQLKGISQTAPAKGLALLDERLADALLVQERSEREAEMRQAPSSFFVDHKLEVHEVEASAFVQVPLAPPSTQPPALWAS